MKDTFKVLFYARKNYVNKDGEVAIMVRVSVDGQRTQFSSRLTVNLDNWDAKANLATGKSMRTQEINDELRDIKSALTFHYREIKRHESFVTVYKVRDAFLGVGVKMKMLLEVFEKYNEDLEQRIGKGISKSVVNKYKLTKNRLQEFIKHQYNTKDVAIKEINYSFIYNFESYLRIEYNCGTNTVAKFLQQFKRVTTLAKNNGWLQADPFSTYKISLEKVDRGYLTMAELSKIMQKKFSIKRLEQVKDIFVFSCFTGLAYVDVKNLEENDIQTSFDGKLWIIKNRKKTNVQSNVLLLDIPKKILDKYKGMQLGKQLLPTLTNQRMNSYLKEIADLCGIEKNLTFHLARHTFATTVTLTKGVPIETVSRMLGHTNIRTTQIYARITNSKIGNDMEQLSKKLEGIDDLLVL